MSSNRRIQSSRANGAKSRGPVTPEGKRKSAANSVRHGLLTNLVVLDDEKPGTFSDILTALTAEFVLQTEAERLMVENMAVARWRQMRIWAIERATLQSEIEKHDDTVVPPATRAALAFRALADQSRTLDLLNRYESRFDRQFARSFNLLMKLADPDNPLKQSRQTNLVPQSDTVTAENLQSSAGAEGGTQAVSEPSIPSRKVTAETSQCSAPTFYKWKYAKALAAVLLCLFACLTQQCSRPVRTVPSRPLPIANGGSTALLSCRVQFKNPAVSPPIQHRRPPAHRPQSPPPDCGFASATTASARATTPKPCTPNVHASGIAGAFPTEALICLFLTGNGFHRGRGRRRPASYAANLSQRLPPAIVARTPDVATSIERIGPAAKLPTNPTRPVS